jgi:hypothetical protein
MDDLFGIIELAKRMLEEAELENGPKAESRRPSMKKRSSITDRSGFMV